MSTRLKEAIKDDLIGKGDVLVVFEDDPEDYKVVRVFDIIFQLRRPYQAVLQTLYESGRVNRRTVDITKLHSVQCEVLDNMDNEEWTLFCEFTRFSNVWLDATEFLAEKISQGRSASDEGEGQVSLFSPASVT